MAEPLVLDSEARTGIQIAYLIAYVVLNETREPQNRKLLEPLTARIASLTINKAG